MGCGAYNGMVLATGVALFDCDAPLDRSSATALAFPFRLALSPRSLQKLSFGSLDEDAWVLSTALSANSAPTFNRLVNTSLCGRLSNEPAITDVAERRQCFA